MGPLTSVGAHGPYFKNDDHVPHAADAVSLPADGEYSRLVDEFNKVYKFGEADVAEALDDLSSLSWPRLMEECELFALSKAGSKEDILARFEIELRKDLLGG